MTATNHVLTGALIASAVHNPWLALPAAFASHFVLDALPHYGRVGVSLASNYFKHRLLADMIIAALCLVILFLLQPDRVWAILAGGILGASPDLMWYARFAAANHHQQPPSFGFIRRFHSRVQWYEKPPGAIVEVFWCLVMVLALSIVLGN